MLPDTVIEFNIILEKGRKIRFFDYLLFSLPNPVYFDNDVEYKFLP